MYSCFYCKSNFVICWNLIKHIRYQCKKALNYKGYYCGQESCSRYYTSPDSLYRHLLSKHPNPRYLSQYCSMTKSVIQTETAVSPSISSLDSQPINNSHPDSAMPHLKHHLEKFFAGLYGTLTVPRSVVQTVSNEITSFLTKSGDTILTVLKYQLSIKGIEISDDAMTVIEDIVSDLKNCQSSLTSEYKRFQSFQKMETLILPTEIIIGQRMDHKQTAMGNSLVPVPCTMQVIPIDKVIHNFLLLPGVLNDILGFLEQLEQDSVVIENIMQGTVWKCMVDNVSKSEGEIHLPLVLFFDDFEVGNPLGSHA